MRGHSTRFFMAPERVMQVVPHLWSHSGQVEQNEGAPSALLSLSGMASKGKRRGCLLGTLRDHEKHSAVTPPTALLTQGRSRLALIFSKGVFSHLPPVKPQPALSGYLDDIQESYVGLPSLGAGTGIWRALSPAIPPPPSPILPLFCFPPNHKWPSLPPNFPPATLFHLLRHPPYLIWLVQGQDPAQPNSCGPLCQPSWLLTGHKCMLRTYVSSPAPFRSILHLLPKTKLFFILNEN